MRILGIDPGMKSTGVCLLEYCRDWSSILKTVTITTPPDFDIIRRVCFIFDAVEELVMEEAPNLIGIEDFVDQKTTLTVDAQDVNRVIGALYLFSERCPIFMLGAADWKHALCPHVPRDKRSKDFAVRRSVEIRTRYSFGSAKQHEIDAAGIALVAGDRNRFERHIKEQNCDLDQFNPASRREPSSRRCS